MAINVRLQARGNYAILGLEDLATHVERPRRMFGRHKTEGYYYYSAADGATWCDKPFLRIEFADPSKEGTCWIAIESRNPATCLECLGRERT